VIEAIRTAVGLVFTVAFVWFLAICARELVAHWKKLSRWRVAVEGVGVFVVVLVWVAASFVAP
jgi:hypothetical protein